MIQIKPILPNSHNDKQADTLLDALTGAPPTDADERFFHNDLRYMSAAALWHELVLIYLRLSLDKWSHSWWRERYRRIREEMQRRER